MPNASLSELIVAMNDAKLSVHSQNQFEVMGSLGRQMVEAGYEAQSGPMLDAWRALPAAAPGRDVAAIIAEATLQVHRAAVAAGRL